MEYRAFERLIARLARDIPDDYLEGVAGVEVSPKTVPHPTRADVFTLGECIPVHGDRDETLSRVVLYHGSFRALAALDQRFAWRDEAWETLTHELRHHLEWRADAGALEAYDWAAEQNFARRDGERFDPMFFRSGEQVEPGVYRVDDDVFFDRLVRGRPAVVEVPWHGARYSAPVPDLPLPLFLVLEGLAVPPAGDVVAVLRRRPRLRDLLRRAPAPSVANATARRMAS